jgi:hypothetical protein
MNIRARGDKKTENQDENDDNQPFFVLGEMVMMTIRKST